MLASLEATKNKCLSCYDSYDFANMLQELLGFLIGDCSAFYLSITKDPLYCDEKNAKLRKEAQSVIYQIVETLSRLLTPVLPFTMDEVYSNIPFHKEKHIFLEDMPKVSHNYGEELLAEFERQKRMALETVAENNKLLIEEMKPKADYCKAVLDSPDPVAITLIAKDYGWSAKKMNQYLHEHDVQYRQGDTWVLYAAYAGFGYTKSKTSTFISSDGVGHAAPHQCPIPAG